MTHTPSPSPRPLRLRPIVALDKVNERLALAHCTSCPLPDGGVAALLMRRHGQPRGERDTGLALSTRFGAAVAFDYGPVLLACTGVDVAGPPGTCTALAGYAFAALAPSIQAALGEPQVCDEDPSALGRALTVDVSIRFALPSVRLALFLRMAPEGIHALLDGGPWERVDPPAPAPPPSWLASLRAKVPLVVGAVTLPLSQYRSLARGDIVRPATSSFDVTGRAVLRVGSRLVRVRWLDSHQCFEVQDMQNDAAAPPEDTDEQASADVLPIDTADIPVRLSFSLGVLSLTVGRIAALGRGSLLPLEQGLPPIVKIEANGSPVGVGELVDLDGRLAVEITQWPHGDPSSRAS